MYALIEFAGKQYKVEDGSSIKVPHVEGKVGSKVVIDKILYLDDGKKKTVGTPLVSGTRLESKIVSHERGKKVVVFKFKRRKGYQKKNNHRQSYTILKVGKLESINKQKITNKSKTLTEKKTIEKKKPAKNPIPKTVAKKPTTNKKTLNKSTETKK